MPSQGPFRSTATQALQEERIGEVRVVCGDVHGLLYRYKKIFSVDLGGRGDTLLSGQLTLGLFGSDSVSFVLRVVSKQSALVCRQCNSVSSKVKNIFTNKVPFMPVHSWPKLSINHS